MDILISFTASVGVVEAAKAVKGVAIDIINHSIVLWLENKKIPNPIGTGNWLNSRDLNKKEPPSGFPGDSFTKRYVRIEIRQYDFVQKYSSTHLVRHTFRGIRTHANGRGLFSYTLIYYNLDGSVQSYESRTVQSAGNTISNVPSYYVNDEPDIDGSYQHLSYIAYWTVIYE